MVRKLVDEDYAHKDRIVLVMDNLNTHRPSSLYEAFDPTEARRIAERLEIHYTPKHGSWLNMAEIELVCCRGSAWTAGFQTKRYWSKRPGLGRTSGTGTGYEWTGVSPPPMRVSSSSLSTHQYKPDGLLVPFSSSSLLTTRLTQRNTIAPCPK